MRDPKKATPQCYHIKTDSGQNEKLNRVRSTPFLAKYRGNNFIFYPNTYAFYSIERYHSNQRLTSGFPTNYIDPVFSFNEANRRFIKQGFLALLLFLMVVSISNAIFNTSLINSSSHSITDSVNTETLSNTDITTTPTLPTPSNKTSFIFPADSNEEEVLSNPSVISDEMPENRETGINATNSDIAITSSLPTPSNETNFDFSSDSDSDELLSNSFYIGEVTSRTKKSNPFLNSAETFSILSPTDISNSEIESIEIKDEPGFTNEAFETQEQEVNSIRSNNDSTIDEVFTNEEQSSSQEFTFSDEAYKLLITSGSKDAFNSTTNVVTTSRTNTNYTPHTTGNTTTPIHKRSSVTSNSEIKNESFETIKYELNDNPNVQLPRISKPSSATVVKEKTNKVSLVQTLDQKLLKQLNEKIRSVEGKSNSLDIWKDEKATEALATLKTPKSAKPNNIVKSAELPVIPNVETKAKIETEVVDTKKESKITTKANVINKKETTTKVQPLVAKKEKITSLAQPNKKSTTLKAKQEATENKKVNTTVSAKTTESDRAKAADQMTEEKYLNLVNISASEGKLYFLKFEAQWCLPCRQMEENTFQEQNVKKYVDDNYHSLRVDIDDFEGYNLKKKFNIVKIPAMIIFNSSGEEVDRYDVSMGPSKMLEILKKNNIQANRKKRMLSKPVLETKRDLPSEDELLVSLVEGTKIFFKEILPYQADGKLVNKLKESAKKNWVKTDISFTIENEEVDLVKGAEFVLKLKDVDTRAVLTNQIKNTETILKSKGIRFSYSASQINVTHFNHEIKTGKNYEVQIFLIRNDKEHLLMNGTKLIMSNGKIRN